MKSLQARVLVSFLATFLIIGLGLSLGLNSYIESQYYKQKIEKMIQTGNQIRTHLQIAQSDTQAIEDIEYLGYQFEGRITLLDIQKDQAMILYENHRYIYNHGRRVKEINYKGEIAWIINTDYPVKNSLWLGYLSKIDDTKFAWLEIPVVTIDEGIAAFQSYVWKALLLGFIISILMSYLLAKSITNPVAELNCLAKKIGKLEFDSSYHGKRVDEIGQLGATLNEITQILKTTIGDLQTELAKKQQLEQLRKRFVAQVSHELQTPISVISSYTEALSDDMVDPDEQNEYYMIILDECNKMSKVVKDLLDLSSLESGLIEYKQEWIDLPEFLDNLVRKQELIVKSENKQIFYQWVPAEILGDSFRLEQAIGNILSNNIKHAKSWVRLDLSQRQQQLVLQISNDGAPIDRADLPHLWDSFYKGKNKKSGTGLGLAIASQIFKAHQIKYLVYNADTNNEVTYELIFTKWNSSKN